MGSCLQSVSPELIVRAKPSRLLWSRCPTVQLWIVLLGVGLAPSPAASQELTNEGLLELSLEDLLEVVVSVASLEDEAIIGTPAVVSYLDPEYSTCPGA